MNENINSTLEHKLGPVFKEMQPVICIKCNNDEWIFKNGIVLTSIPPQFRDEYECSVCGHPYIKESKGTQFPAPVKLFE